MGISMDIPMDIPMDIHEKICGYGCGYGWEISYPRQPWQFTFIDMWHTNALLIYYDKK